MSAVSSPGPPRPSVIRSTACASHEPRSARVACSSRRAVDLLGHVGQMEVGRERPDQADRRERIDLRQHRRGGVAVGAHQLPHALDQLEHLAPLLAHDRATQQHAELANVTAQRGVGLAAGGGGALGQHRSPCMVTKCARRLESRLADGGRHLGVAAVLGPAVGRGVEVGVAGARVGAAPRAARGWRRGRRSGRRGGAAVTPVAVVGAAERRAPARVRAERDEPLGRRRRARSRPPTRARCRGRRRRRRAAPRATRTSSVSTRSLRAAHASASSSASCGSSAGLPGGEAAVRAVEAAVRAGLGAERAVGAHELVDEVSRARARRRRAGCAGAGRRARRAARRSRGGPRRAPTTSGVPPSPRAADVGGRAGVEQHAAQRGQVASRRPGAAASSRGRWRARGRRRASSRRRTSALVARRRRHAEEVVAVRAARVHEAPGSGRAAARGRRGRGPRGRGRRGRTARPPSRRAATWRRSAGHVGEAVLARDDGRARRRASAARRGARTRRPRPASRPRAEARSPSARPS